MSGSTRTVIRLPWAICGVSVLLSSGTLILILVNLDQPRPEWLGPTVSALVDSLAAPILPVVGAIIAAHRPRNAIGWLLLVGALASSIGSFAGEWTWHALLVVPGSVPGGELASVLMQTTWTLHLSVLPFVILLFPDGAVLSPRWRIVAGVAAIPALFVFPVLLASAWSDRGLSLLIEGEETLGAIDVVILVAVVCTLVSIGAAIVALALRFLRGDATRRRQIKWVVTAAAVLLVDGITATAFETDAVWRQVVSSLTFNLIPVAMAVAILRYRLYEIDRIINRALVYGALTLLIAGGYWLSVLALQSVLPAPERSPLVVAASTLAIVALFRPLRARVQSFIDRRFYRTRYDAERTVADFGIRLRQEVDLDELGADLVGVVNRTMQPASVSLWLQAPRGFE